MISNRLGSLRAAAAISLPGGVAAAIVLRTLAVYWGRDWVASAVVFAIASALAIGLRELVVRQRRVSSLERELRSLPLALDQGSLDKAGPQLSALLRARLDNQPLPLSNDPMTPFLTGLLVMLGLLGTLLGLFQTLHGAGHALTSSADLDALRRGLSAPIAGLTRSFGCAAAGISASAMLGLASALLRRREAHALRAVHVYALGPLREHSASARQLRAIEALASRDDALPVAAQAIERAGEALAEVSSKLISLQQNALDAQQQGMRELLTHLRREFASAAAETGAALHARMAPLLEEDATKRRAEAADALEAMRRRLDEAESARAAAHAAELAALTRLHASTLAGLEQRDEALGARWQELVERFDAQLAAARDSESERLRSLDAQVAATRERESEHASQLERVSSALSAELEQRQSNERRQTEQIELALAQLSAAAAAVERGIASQEGVLGQLVERVSPLFEEAARSSRETAQLALDQIERSAQLLEATVARQGAAIEGLVERVTALLPELAAAAQAGAVNTLDRLRALGEEQAVRLSQLEATLARERHDHVKALSELLGDHAVDLEQRLTHTSSAVEEAAAIWRASTVEMQAVAELFATSVERQREAAEAWLDSLGAVENAVAQAGRDAASDALSEQLASTQELFARQLQFQRELLTQLRTLRAGPSKTRVSSGGQDVPAGE